MRQHIVDARVDAPPIRCLYADQPAHRPHCQLTAVVAYGAIALCADCDTRRSTIGKATTGRRLPPQDPLDILTWISHADTQLHQAHKELAAAVQRARTHGHSWTTIGERLAITRQAAQQRFRQENPPAG